MNTNTYDKRYYKQPVPHECVDDEYWSSEGQRGIEQNLKMGGISIGGDGVGGG